MKTREDCLSAVLQGKRLTCSHIRDNGKEYVFLDDSLSLYYNDGTEANYDFSDPENWEIRVRCFDIKKAIELRREESRKIGNVHWSECCVLSIDADGYVQKHNTKTNTYLQIHTDDILIGGYYMI